MGAKFFDLVRVRTATTGTGTITLGAAIGSYLSFAGASVPDGAIVTYGILDGANSEAGWGVYTSASGTLTRNVKKSTNGGAALNLSGSAQVFITAIAGSLQMAVATRTDLAGVDSNLVPAVTLGEGSRAGIFAWQSGDQSAAVTRDPRQGLFVAPSSAPTGASGAWKRIATEVTIEQFGGGIDVADNTQALLDAIAAVSGPVRVMFTQIGNYTFTQASVILITKAGVYLEGRGRGTALKYVPTANGYFLHWKAPVAFSPLRGGGLRNISVWSPDMTYTKTAVVEEAISDFLLENMAIGVEYQTLTYTIWTGGTGSCGYRACGWDFNRINNAWISADSPISVGMNPYWSYNDQWHWTDLVLVTSQNIGSFNCVQVDPGAVFSSFTVDGYQSWNGGASGFYNQDTGGVNEVSSVNTAGTGYAVGDTFTLAGGTWTTLAPVALVLAVNGSGGVVNASIYNPGQGLTAMPASNLFTAGATSGVGTGAKLVCDYTPSFNMKFANVRLEQGFASVGASSWNFYLQCGGTSNSYMSSVTFENCWLDGDRNGILINGVYSTRIVGCTHTGNTTYSVIPFQLSGAQNHTLRLEANQWVFNSSFPLASSITGVNLVNYTPNPTLTNATALQEAYYSKSVTYTIPTLAKITAKLNADVALASGTYTDVISVAQGTSGTWLVTANIVVTDTAAANNINVRLWGGGTLIANAMVSVPAANRYAIVSVSGFVTNPSGNIKVSLASTTTTAKATWSASGDGEDSNLTAVRIG